MIKILKKGTKRKKECYDCGALLSYDMSDDVQVGYVEGIGYNGMTYREPYKYIVCPQCGCTIPLDKGEYNDNNTRL